jgi:hypothetical protein
MDGEEGEFHPFWAYSFIITRLRFLDKDDLPYLCLYHSGYLANKSGVSPSKLCWADKYGTILMPAWLWVFLGTLTGEIHEYMSCERHEGNHIKSPFEYFRYISKIIMGRIAKNA